MIKAVLLDLDDTLVKVSDSFVSAYLHLADSFFHERWGHEQISNTLLHFARGETGAIAIWETKTAAALRLIQRAVGRSLDEVRAGFDEFYARVYPQLQGCVEPVPGAARLIEFLRERPCTLVIATNPLYPAEAIRQRLAWGGLEAIWGDAVVTSGDIMHFAKPDPAYYAEILGRIGVEPDEAVMVGDSVENDMLPAALVGMNTFQIDHGASASSANDDERRGTLDDFLRRIGALDGFDTWIAPTLKPQAVEHELRGNLGALFGLLDEVKPHQWRQHPDPNEWSIMQVVCHLLESETSVQQPRLQRILTEDNPFLASPQQPPGPREFNECDEDGVHAARQFAERRQELIEWLRRLKPDDWQRPARHSIFGLTTLLEMAHFTAQHDRLHLNQLCQTLGRCD